MSEAPWWLPFSTFNPGTGIQHGGRDLRPGDVVLIKGEDNRRFEDRICLNGKGCSLSCDPLSHKKRHVVPTAKSLKRCKEATTKSENDTFSGRKAITVEYWKYIWQKARHSNPLRHVVDGLWKIGICMRPFYIFQERLSDMKISEWHAKFDGYELGFLGMQDMGVISCIPFRNESSLEQLYRRLREGKRCFGMKHQGKLVAFTWCDLDRFSFESVCYDLSEDEAYLFDMHTLEVYRGRGIAPHLWCQIFKELDLIGKKRFYSVSDCFNTPALKFKQKLNARIIELGLFVELFGKWRFSRTIKKYETSR